MNPNPNFTSHYIQSLENVFGQLNDEQLAQFSTNSKISTYESGEFLFKQGDFENPLYIVLSGRFRVIFDDGSQTKILGDVANGEPIGELALFTKEPRGASVVAIRKSVVVEIKESNYFSIADKFPSLAYNITNFVIKRLNQNAIRFGNSAPAKNIVLIKLQPEMDISPWTEEIREQLGNMNVEINVYTQNEMLDKNIDEVFDKMENQKGINLLVCDEENEIWAKQCIIYSDLVLVVSDFHSNSDMYSIEENLKLYDSNILNRKAYLLLLHPENAPTPKNTIRWLKDRKLDMHIHLRKHNAKDMRRFCRIITNNAIGLVLGGGGAKGFSHLGATKALMEAGVEFDFIGGTSAGSLFGMSMSVKDFDFHQIGILAKQGAENKPTSNDYHYPFVSLMTGKKMRKTLHEIFGEVAIEDFWVSSYSVSTNFSSASLQIHERGSAAKAVEASVAIPGIFPPVIINKHLHVDGGVMDNLPIEAMYQKPVKHIIAIALNSQATRTVEIEKVPSAWKIFRSKFFKKKRIKIPGMSSILINSLVLNSLQKQSKMKSQVSFYLELDLRKFGFLDWSKWQELIDKGYEQTKAALNDLPDNDQLWK